MNNPFTNPFRTDAALRINSRRLEHLAWMDLDICGRSVLEVGAGQGMLTSFFLDRGCRVTVTDGRLANVCKLRRRFPNCEVLRLDLERDWPSEIIRRQIVFCYGVLYHLENPLLALTRLCQAAQRLLLIESMVSARGEPVAESSFKPDQSITGWALRPSRDALITTMVSIMPFVYEPVRSPAHEDYPISRIVLIASKEKIENPKLSVLNKP